MTTPWPSRAVIAAPSRWPTPTSPRWLAGLAMSLSPLASPAMRRAFGDHAHRIMGRVAGLVLGEQGQQHVEIGRHLGDHGAVDLGEEAGEQGGLAAPPAEQFDHADPLVALDRGAQRVDRLDRAADRGREADAIVRAEHVIVHRLGHRDDRHALRGEMGREAQGAVAAEGDHRVDAERFEHLQHVAGAVAVRPSVRGIGARGVEDGAAGPVDPAHRLAVQRRRCARRRSPDRPGRSPSPLPSRAGSRSPPSRERRRRARPSGCRH